MRIPGRTGISVTSVIGSAALVVTLGVGGASASPGDGPDGSGHHATPSQAQVDRAREDVRRTADGVDAIKAALAQAQDALDAATVQADMAAEKFDGARWRLGQARRAMSAASAAADRAQRHVVDQRAGIARLAVQSFRGGAQADQLSMIVDQQSAADVLGSYGAMHSASTSMDARYERFRESLTRAKVAKVKATAARAKAARLLGAARDARAEAAAAQTTAAARTSALQVQTAALTRQLAKAQGISVRLARTRAHDLEVQARRAAAAKAARIAAAKEAAQEAAQTAAREAAAEKARQEAANGSGQDHEGTSSTPSESSASGSGSPASSSPAPAPAGGAAAAIAFAKAQIGEPYVWAAAGPDSWDCSGLTMMAWKAGGVSLPHYSVAQYASITHISRDQLQPGDLAFWGSSPGSIYHVAMYLGGGELIEAPRTGLDVRIESIDDWIPPTYFGRP